MASGTSVHLLDSASNSEILKPVYDELVASSKTQSRMVAVVSNKDGLGNRIKPLVSALRFTDNVFSTCNTFNLIFKRRVPVVSQIEPEFVKFWDWRFVLKPTDDLGDYVGVALVHNVYTNEMIPAPPRSIDLEFFRIPETVRRDISSVFLSLGFSDTVKDAVEPFTADWNSDVISVHIRSWAQNEFRRRNFHNLASFFQAIDRFDSGLRIYLSTDSRSVEAAVLERYGSRILLFPEMDQVLRKRSYDSHGYSYGDSTIVRDFCEMICLSRGTVLIGSYLSTFTECAWWFGGCRQHVIIV
jgi:hypothetical protein